MLALASILTVALPAHVIGKPRWLKPLVKETPTPERNEPRQKEPGWKGLKTLIDETPVLKQVRNKVAKELLGKREFTARGKRGMLWLQRAALAYPFFDSIRHGMSGDQASIAIDLFIAGAILFGSGLYHSEQKQREQDELGKTIQDALGKRETLDPKLVKQLEQYEHLIPDWIKVRYGKVK